MSRHDTLSSHWQTTPCRPLTLTLTLTLPRSTLFGSTLFGSTLFGSALFGCTLLGGRHPVVLGGRHLWVWTTPCRPGAHTYLGIGKLDDTLSPWCTIPIRCRKAGRHPVVSYVTTRHPVVSLADDTLSSHWQTTPCRPGALYLLGVEKPDDTLSSISLWTTPCRGRHPVVSCMCRVVSWCRLMCRVVSCRENNF
jgi:hypothetical protein